MSYFASHSYSSFYFSILAFSNYFYCIIFFLFFSFSLPKRVPFLCFAIFPILNSFLCLFLFFTSLSPLYLSFTNSLHSNQFLLILITPPSFFFIDCPTDLLITSFSTSFSIYHSFITSVSSSFLSSSPFTYCLFFLYFFLISSSFTPPTLRFFFLISLSSTPLRHGTFLLLVFFFINFFFIFLIFCFRFLFYFILFFYILIFFYFLSSIYFSLLFKNLLLTSLWQLLQSISFPPFFSSSSLYLHYYGTCHWFQVPNGYKILQ